MAANATDGNQGTYWEGVANAYPNWIRVDLGGTSSVSKVVLKLPTGWGSRTQTLSVQGSTNDSTYTTLVNSATYTFNPSANTVTITFAAANVRYVKINLTANSGATGGQVSELEVYGGAITPPTPTPTPTATPTPPPGTLDTNIKGKTIAGYQGWFAAQGDGSPVNRWVHWNGGAAPSPGHLSFELYPDVREYTTTFQTGFANLGNGQPSKLFSSYTAQTVNTHFKWMKDYNIDGAAVQRFGTDITDPNSKALRDAVALNVKNAAEANGRIFYTMYDVSGMGSNFVSVIENDWTNTIVNTLQLTSSPNYATQDGKKVVCIWGIGFTGNKPGTPQEWLTLINWFKNQGYYVIGGLPTNWRTGTGDSQAGFMDVYKSLNMISPWSVGRFKYDVEVDNFKTNYLIPDRDFCIANGIDYQPVVFPGFAWSNWNGGDRNMIPRNQGKFFWRQAYNVKSSNISNMYIAMFDEYDEGTAIAKAAEDSSMIPTNQYFLTLDADGVHLSSDFYLRLAGAANQMLKGQAPLTLTVPIPNQ